MCTQRGCESGVFAGVLPVVSWPRSILGGIAFAALLFGFAPPLSRCVSADETPGLTIEGPAAEPSAFELASVEATSPTLAEAMQRIETLENTIELILQSSADGSRYESGSAAPGPCLPGDLYCDRLDSADSTQHATHYVVYDRGWTLRPYDSRRTPFELRTELHNQFRYTKFDQDGEPPNDSAGRRRVISDRNDFDINRGRVVFAGYAFDPALGFYVNLDYSTVAADSIQPLLAWITYECSETLAIYCGLGKVPGTWEWQQTSRYTLGVDRSLATTFFRPSISAGVWAIGSITEQMHYTAFVGDGYNTLTLRADELDTSLVYSGLSWWEPLGEFGVGFSDLENHASLVGRIGHGLTYTHNERGADSAPGPEGTVFRLSDGTRLTEPGALRTGDRVAEFDVWLYTAHLGLKRRGCSFSTEYYFRWLRDMIGTQGVPFESQFDHGFFVQAGTFVTPKTLEAFLRASRVSGGLGTGEEVSLGVNWYPFSQRGTRATLEVTDVNDSPAQQSRTGFVAGGSGTLVRAQLWTFF